MRVRPFTAPLSQCAYLPDQQWQMTYAAIDELSQDEFHILINQGWRKFGKLLFRPACPSCRACQPIRVPVEQFKPNRSQRRLIKQNAEAIDLYVGSPVIENKRIDLYERHHKFHSETRDWPEQHRGESISSILNFIEGPYPIEEWAYYLGDELIAIAYIDVLPNGLSGIYFYHSPEHRKYSLGNWICLTMIYRARQLQLPYIYFGYYIKGSISMEYKAAFQPNEILVDDGVWEPFLSRDKED